jgi:hypothetical protein
MTRLFSAALLVLVISRPASALPTMIRLGYHECAACHIAPQGGGPLTPYGKSIDQAQSLRAGEYRPSQKPLLAGLGLQGRVTEDVRFAASGQYATNGGRTLTTLWPRLAYRNVTSLSGRVSAAATVTLQTSHESGSLNRASAPSRPPVFVNTALVHYRAAKSLTLAAGRDQLPSGVNVPDLGAFIHSRNERGDAAAPVQLKAHWSGPRWLLSPFVFRFGREADDAHEKGTGVLAEADVLGKRTTVVGMTWLRAAGARGERRVMGVHTRLGFGRWGVLVEHDRTDRLRAEWSRPARQHASYAQVFWAVREWLVASAIAERLNVVAPNPERLAAGKLELNARLTNQASVGVSARLQHDALINRTSRSLALQVAIKSPQ